MNGTNYPQYGGMVVGGLELEKAILEVVSSYSGRTYDIVEEVGSLYVVDGQKNYSPLSITVFLVDFDLRGKDIFFQGRSMLKAIYNQIYLNAQNRRKQDSYNPADWWKE